MSSRKSDVTRRQFLAGIGAAGAAAVIAGYGLTVWRHDDAGNGATRSSALRIGSLGNGRADRTLVVIELGGGNDGLNTVVPLADPAYRTLRPTLAVADAIALDDTIGLHPKLAKLAARYQGGHVAIVEGVGFTNPNLSHFASLARWWTGDPAGGAGAGWIGRYLDGTVGFEDPLAAIGIGPVPSPALVGTQSFATSISDARGLQPAAPSWAGRPDDLVAAWAAFAPKSPDTSSVLGPVQSAIRLTVEARTKLATDLAAVTGASDPTDGLYNGQAGRRGAVDALRLAGQLVAGPNPPRVVYVSGLGDYDTHQGLADRHPVLMSDLDNGLDAFFAVTDKAGVTDRVLVMTASEFGRRPAENGSGGTDHGSAAPHFLIGNAVKGGRYGQPPSLTKLDGNGNLVAGVDVRSYYATATEGWLGVDAAAILGKGFTPLPILA